MNHWIETIASNPKRLFLIDGFGAILSAFLLGVVLVKLEGFFGISSTILYSLASVPILFFMFDFICYAIYLKTIKPYLIGIALLNFLYCFLSIGVIFQFSPNVTFLGWTYIGIEISIILFLVMIELKIANKIV